jgi:hypothetical protein
MPRYSDSMGGDSDLDGDDEELGDLDYSMSD